MSGRHPLASKAFKHVSAKKVDEPATPGAAPAITPEEKSDRLDMVLFRVYQIHKKLDEIRKGIEEHDKNGTGQTKDPTREQLLHQLQTLETTLFILTTSASPNKIMVEQTMKQEFGERYEGVANLVLAEAAYYLGNSNIGAKDSNNPTAEEKLRSLPENWSDLQKQHEGALTADDIKKGTQEHLGTAKILFSQLTGRRQNEQYQIMYGLAHAQKERADNPSITSDFVAFASREFEAKGDGAKIPPFNSKTHRLEGHITLYQLESMLGSYKKRLLELFHNRPYAGRGYLSKFGENVSASLQEATNPVEVKAAGGPFTLDKIPVVSLGPGAISLPWFSSGIGSTIPQTLSFLEGYFKILQTNHPEMSISQLLSTHSNGLNKGEEGFNKNSEGKLVNEIVLTSIPFGMNPHAMAAWCKQTEELAKILGIAFRIDWNAVRRQPAVQHSQALLAQLDDVQDSLARYSLDFAETVKASTDAEIDRMAEALGKPELKQDEERTPEDKHDILCEYVFGSHWNKEGIKLTGSEQAESAAARVTSSDPQPKKSAELAPSMAGHGPGATPPTVNAAPAALPTPEQMREKAAAAAEKKQNPAPGKK